MDSKDRDFGIYSRYDKKVSSDRRTNNSNAGSSNDKSTRNKMPSEELDSDASTIDGNFDTSNDIIEVDNCDGRGERTSRVLPVKINPFASVSKSKLKSAVSTNHKGPVIDDEVCHIEDRVNDKASKSLEKNFRKSRPLHENKPQTRDTTVDLEKQLLTARLQHESDLYEMRMELLNLDKRAKLAELDTKEMQRHMVQIEYDRKLQRYNDGGRKRRKSSKDLMYLDRN